MFLNRPIVSYLLVNFQKNLTTHIFSIIFIVFEDKNLGMKISLARMFNGLYYFEENMPRGKIAQEFHSIFSMSIQEQLIFWHYRLHHLSFIYLKNLFPDLFKNKDPLKFKCESC